jgi:hypothetical protein
VVEARIALTGTGRGRRVYRLEIGDDLVHRPVQVMLQSCGRRMSSARHSKCSIASDTRWCATVRHTNTRSATATGTPEDRKPMVTNRRVVSGIRVYAGALTTEPPG